MERRGVHQCETPSSLDMAHRISIVSYHQCGEALVTMLSLRLTTRTFTRMKLTPQVGGSSPNAPSHQDSMPKAEAHTTTQLVAPGNVFVATKAPKLRRLSHTPQLEAPNKSREPPRLRENNNRLGYQRALEERALGHPSTQE